MRVDPVMFRPDIGIGTMQPPMIQPSAPIDGGLAPLPAPAMMPHQPQMQQPQTQQVMPQMQPHPMVNQPAPSTPMPQPAGPIAQPHAFNPMQRQQLASAIQNRMASRLPSSYHQRF